MEHISRRAALAGLVLTSAAQAAPEDAVGAALIDNFLKLWSAPDATGAKLAAFMTEDGEFRYERKAPVVGRAALTAAFDGYLAGGKRYRMEPVETHAKGPVVFQYRRETLISNGSPGHTETIAGIFILAGGRIKIWENFLAEG